MSTFYVVFSTCHVVLSTCSVVLSSRGFVLSGGILKYGLDPGLDFGFWKKNYSRITLLPPSLKIWLKKKEK